MKESLKNILKERIRVMGILKYEEAAKIAVEEGYRISNMERRLRELVKENPSIQPVMKQSKKGSWYIGSYQYSPLVFSPAPIAPPEKKNIEALNQMVLDMYDV